jgi:bifunctional DNA-binding transcriptional regulator/antitoxin component of YhaV-PrlF toxin-antitoxin module
MTQQISLGTRKVSWAKKQVVVPEAVLNVLEIEQADSLKFILCDGKVFVEKVKP